MSRTRYLVAALASLLAVGLPSAAHAKTPPHPERPTVLVAKAVPSVLSARGGYVTVVGKARAAERCWVRALRGPKLSGFPGNHPCAKGAYRLKVHVGPTASARVLKLELRAHRNGAKDGIGVFYIAQAGTPRRLALTAPSTTATTPPTTAAPPAAPTTSTTATTAPLIYYVVPTVTTTTTAPSPTTTTPAPTTTTVPPVALDPTCTQLTAVAYTMSCYFSASEVGGGVAGGVLSFLTTQVPNDSNATLATPASNGCNINVTVSQSASTCVVTYPAPGAYYVETLYDGGPGAYSTSTLEAINVAAAPTTTTTTTVPSTTTTTTFSTVSETISQIDALGPEYNGAWPGGCGAPSYYECMELGVEGLPAHGTVTFSVTEPAFGGGTTTGTCTLDLATASTCYALFDPSTQASSAMGWIVSAEWSGYVAVAANGDITDYTAPVANYPLQTPPTGGSWYDLVGYPPA